MYILKNYGDSLLECLIPLLNEVSTRVFVGPIDYKMA